MVKGGGEEDRYAWNQRVREELWPRHRIDLGKKKNQPNLATMPQVFKPTKNIRVAMSLPTGVAFAPQKVHTHHALPVWLVKQTSPHLPRIEKLDRIDQSQLAAVKPK
jgi:hypothetical protein